MRPDEWQASPRHVRVFHGATSTVLERVQLDAAKRLVVDTSPVTVSGVALDESDIDAMRKAMTERYQAHMADLAIERSMGWQA